MANLCVSSKTDRHLQPKNFQKGMVPSSLNSENELSIAQAADSISLTGNRSFFMSVLRKATVRRPSR